MKVLLLNPPFRIKEGKGYERFFVRGGSRWPYSEYKKVNETSIYRPFPFFLAYTAGILCDSGYDVEVIDGVALQYEVKQFVDISLSKNPDIVIIEIAPFSIQSDLKLAKAFKAQNKHTILIAVGPFVPLLVEYILEKGNFDYVVNGEYEFAVLQFIENLKNDVRKKIRGIIELHLPQNREANKKEYTELIEPLDRLPLPKREIFPSNDNPNINAYWDVFCQFRPAVQIQTSRGCSYRCYFCLWNQVVYRESRYRVFSVNRVIDEIEHIINKYAAKEIYIDDDDFTIDKNRVRQICREIRNRNLKIKWSCMADSINLDEEIISEMASANCIGIKFGVESASQNVLKEIGKPVNLKRVKDIVKWLKKYRIRSHVSFVFGLLNETFDSMRETLEFAKELNTDSVQFSIATPYPGTKFYEILKKKNMIAEFDWKNYDGSSKCVISYPQLSSERVENFFSKAFKQWLISKLTNINWMVRQMIIMLRIVLSQNREYNLKLLKKILRLIK